MNKQQAGFTLIELIAVIVILGILAATAIPKFVSLSTDARVAKVNAAAGAMKSAAGMTHGKYLINQTSPQTFEGVDVTFVNEYPNAASIAAVSGLTSSDYTLAVTATTATVSALSTGTTCTATYTEATSGATATPATVTTNTTGC